MPVTEPSVGATGWNSWGHDVTTVVNAVETAPARLDALESGVAAGVNTVTAANGTITVAGTAADPTVAVGTITESQVTNLTSDLSAKLVKASNLSDLASASTARTNLGLAPIAASGSATNLSTGTVPTARLGSGTANSTTFLRGDSTWAAVTGLASSTAVYAADYGAVGDDSTNDTTALQNALNAIPPGGWLVLDHNKIYKITSALTWGSGTNIDGRGSLIHQTSTSANGLVLTDGVNNTARDVKVVGNVEGSPTGSGKGIVSLISANPDTHKLVLERVEVSSFGSDGINLANPILSSFYNVTSEANNGHGFNIHGTSGGAAGTSCSFVSTYANANAQAGYHLDTMTYCAFLGAAADSNGIGYHTIACEGISFTGCGAEGTVKNGGTYNGYSWKVDSSIGVALQGCWVYNNPNIAFWFTNTSTNCSIIACRENTPVAGAVHLLQVDAGSAVASAAISGATSNLFSGDSLSWLGAPTVNVNDYGAKGDGSTNDTAAIQAAFDAANTAGGAIVYFPAGTYVTSNLTYYGNIRLVGAGRGSTVLKLVAAANTDLLTSYQFSSLTGTTTNNGAHHVGFADITIDGNKVNQSSGSGAGIKHYGAMVTMDRVIIRNCRGDGFYSEWNPATDVITDGCESVINAVAAHDNGANGFNYRGAHDSIFSNCIAFGNVTCGFWIRTSASASQCHSWSNSTAQQYAWKLEGAVFLSNSQGEGASVAQVAVLFNDCTVVGGKYYAGSVNGGKGIIIGDATHTGIAGTRVETIAQDCPAGLIDFTYSGGAGYINLNAWSTGTGVVGTPPNNEHCQLNILGGASGPFSSTGGYVQAVGELTAKNASGTDLFDVFGTAISVSNGPTVDFYAGNYTSQTARISAATGGFRPGTTSGMGGTMYSGSAAPTSLAGTAGDYYFRTGTPTTTNQRIYICTTTGTPGTWTGIV